jgi:uncharacterized protein YdhG (YjbR/CyaY superfamily)
MKLKNETEKSTKNSRATGKAGAGFTDEEREAMRVRAQELKAESRRASGGKDADGEGELLAKIAELPEGDRALAERIHALVKAAAPELTARTWYGMPAYAKNGQVVCYFQSSHKFKTRYSTFGFSDKAKLDEGVVWPVAFALKELTPDSEEAISALVKKATR